MPGCLCTLVRALRTLCYQVAQGTHTQHTHTQQTCTCTKHRHAWWHMTRGSQIIHTIQMLAHTQTHTMAQSKGPTHSTHTAQMFACTRTHTRWHMTRGSQIHTQQKCMSTYTHTHGGTRQGDHKSHTHAHKQQTCTSTYEHTHSGINVCYT